jgi:adenylylsulfate kinase
MKPDTSTSKRTLVKGLSFEIVSNLVGLELAYLVFGNFGGCAIFTLVCFVVKLILFYYHERVWHQIPWGKRA